MPAAMEPRNAILLQSLLEALEETRYAATMSENTMACLRNQRDSHYG